MTKGCLPVGCRGARRRVHDPQRKLEGQNWRQEADTASTFSMTGAAGKRCLSEDVCSIEEFSLVRMACLVAATGAMMSDALPSSRSRFVRSLRSLLGGTKRERVHADRPQRLPVLPPRWLVQAAVGIPRGQSFPRSRQVLNGMDEGLRVYRLQQVVLKAGTARTLAVIPC
jgi:hypothetical protein